MISSLLLVKIIPHCFWWITAFASPKLSRNNSVDASQNPFLVEAPEFNHQISEVFHLVEAKQLF
jgi:hypothetical protein